MKQPRKFAGVAHSSAISALEWGTRNIGRNHGCPILARSSRLGGKSFLLLAAIATLLLCVSSRTVCAQKTAVLDRVVAVVDNQAILASDVDDEMRFNALQSGTNSPADTPQNALNRVIDRTLIDQQRALQPGVAEISAKEVDAALAKLRGEIPACAAGACKTDDQWRAVLAAHGFTESEIADRIRERLAILKFIDVRFGVAVRVSQAAVRTYFDQVLKPQLEKSHAVLPALNAVTPRIREILRQQQVDTMVDQWLKGLHSEEQVRVLDVAYGNGESGQ
jgi:peptidyl-prolyl cis-trans isomerase SurA